MAKMTKKEMVNQAINSTMTTAELKKALATLGFETKISVSKKDSNIRNIYDTAGKNKYAEVAIVEKPANTKKEKSTGSHISKSKDDNYVVLYTLKGETVVNRNSSMTTCEEIKAFLKNFKFDVVNIFKSDMTPTRLSAWKGQAVTA